MNKRALLLTAATAALLSGPAFAVGPTTISTATTTALKTSTSGDITIDAAGSVTITAASPVITIDSSNTVSNSGTISNKDTASAIGVEIDLSAGSLTGNFDNIGKIDLTGANGSKIGLEMTGANTFTGNIVFESGSQLIMTGDNSLGIDIASGSTLAGNLQLDGTINLGSASTTISAQNATAVLIGGNINGNVEIGGNIGAVGTNAQGVLMTGNLTGSFTLAGSIAVQGVNTATTGPDPEAGIALGIGGDVGNGIYIAGPVLPSGDSTTRGVVSAHGSASTILITPGLDATPAALTIGILTDATNPGFSFLTRGTISATPIDPNVGATALQVTGISDTVGVTFSGGFYNSGSITATATNDAKGSSSLTSEAVVFGNFVNVPKIVIDGTQSNQGLLTATISGEKGGSAYALRLEAAANNCATSCNLIELDNSGSINAVAATSDATIGSLNAYAIYDLSGSIDLINNTGVISAQTTTLDGGTQVKVAAQLTANTSGVQFINGVGSAVIGDVNFGTGADTFSITGTSGKTSTMTGDLSFGGVIGAGNDQLLIGPFATVSGAVTELLGSSLNVEVQGLGVLDISNDSNSGPPSDFFMNTNAFQIDSGGTLGIKLSQAFDSTGVPVIKSANASLATNAILDLTFGSFLTANSSTQTFILIDTPVTKLSIGDLTQLQTQVCGSVPFFFQGGATCLTAVDTATDSQLVLTLQPKTPQELGLKPGTFGFQLYPFVNAALATDDELGAGLINGIANQDDARTAYGAFAPDVTGSSRAVAIALTDQATGPVAARQRALRMYAAQQGSVTMWGQEFVQRLNESGNAPGGQFRNTGFGFALGLDGGDPFDGRYGGAFTFYSGDTSEQAPRDTKTNSEWYMLTGYTDWRGKGLFFDSQVSVGYGTLTGTRRIDIGNVARTANSNRNSLLLAGGFTTGVVLAGGGTVFTPQFSLDGLTMREDGYTEANGGTGFDLKVDPYYAQSLRGYLGASLRQDLNFGDFYLQPEARVGYRYDFLGEPAKITASFPSVVPISQFSLTGPDPGKGNLVAGGSIATTTGAWSIGLNYDFMRAQDGSTSQTGTISLIGRI